MKRCLAVFVCFSFSVLGAQKSVHWSELDAFVHERAVAIDLNDGKQVKGNHVVIEAGSLTIETKHGRQSVARSLIKDIRVMRPSNHKWEVIGTAVGAGVGAAIAVPVLAETHNEGSSNYDGAAVGVIAGLAVIGYFLGRSSDKRGDVIQVLPD